MSSVEFQVGGATYRAEKLSAMQQFHVARRLGTAAVNSIGDIMDLMSKVGGVKELLKAGAVEAIPIIAKLVTAVGEMTDANSDYVIMTCMSSVSRKEKGAWARVLSGAGDLMFADIELPAMLQIVGKVLEFNFGNFFGDLLSASPAAGAGA